MSPFSMRLAVVALASILGGGCGGNETSGQYQETQKTHENALGSLRSLGAKLERKTYPLGEAWIVDMSGLQITDAAIQSMLELDMISEINFSKSIITDQQFRQLTDSRIGKILFKVNLSDTQISDEGIRGLVNSQFLQDLNISGTQVTEAGISEVQNTRKQNESIASQFKTFRVKN